MRRGTAPRLLFHLRTANGSQLPLCRHSPRPRPAMGMGRGGGLSLLRNGGPCPLHLFPCLVSPPPPHLCLLPLFPSPPPVLLLRGVKTETSEEDDGKQNSEGCQGRCVWGGGGGIKKQSDRGPRPVERPGRTAIHKPGDRLLLEGERGGHSPAAVAAAVTVPRILSHGPRGLWDVLTAPTPAGPLRQHVARPLQTQQTPRSLGKLKSKGFPSLSPSGVPTGSCGPCGAATNLLHRCRGKGHGLLPTPTASSPAAASAFRTGGLRLWTQKQGARLFWPWGHWEEGAHSLSGVTVAGTHLTGSITSPPAEAACGVGSLSPMGPRVTPFLSDPP